MAKQAFLLPVHVAPAGGRVAAGLHGLHTGGGAGPGLQTGAGPGDQHNGPHQTIVTRPFVCGGRPVYGHYVEYTSHFLDCRHFPGDRDSEWGHCLRGSQPHIRVPDQRHGQHAHHRLLLLLNRSVARTF